MTDLDMSVEALSATHRPVPVAPYFSSQIGCSEIAPLMVALRTWDGMPARVVEWCERSAERAALRVSQLKSAPERLKYPALSPVWCADKAREVTTVVGRMPFALAAKAGIVEKETQKDYQASGERLEPTLWRMWKETLALDESCVLDVDSLRSQHDVLAMYPAEWKMRAPSKRHDTDPRLVDYMDGWGSDFLGRRVVVNCKLSRDRKDGPDAPAWIQMQGEIACTRAAFGLLVYGERWNADYIQGPPEERGPIVPFEVEPDAGAERAILATVNKAFERIEEARAAMKGKAA